MKRILTVSFAVAAFALTATSHNGGYAKRSNNGQKSVDALLIGMENAWSEAVVKKDAAALDKIIADDWVGVYPFYTLTKAQELASLTSGEIKVESETTSGMKVRVFENAAVVTGSDDEKGTYKGKDASGHYLWTDVFIKRNGRWQVVASQETLTMRQ
jgi:ketosteroid isomerase-like protein